MEFNRKALLAAAGLALMSSLLQAQENIPFSKGEPALTQLKKAASGGSVTFQEVVENCKTYASLDNSVAVTAGNRSTGNYFLSPAIARKPTGRQIRPTDKNVNVDMSDSQGAKSSRRFPFVGLVLGALIGAGIAFAICPPLGAVLIAGIIVLAAAAGAGAERALDQ